MNNTTTTTNTATAKTKIRPATQQTGLYKPESVRDAAESLGITISDPIASLLASDVEYRIHQVVEEAAKFMRHGRRTTLTSNDIDQALRVLNIEPLYGHSAHNPPTFRRALPFGQAPNVGPVWFIEDEDIDFDRTIRDEKIVLPKAVSYHPHWLAIEGVQPLVPENPPAIPREDGPTAVNGAAGADKLSAKRHSTQQQLLVKQVLSRELQLYYGRLTSSLLPTPPAKVDSTKRTAALASLRHDAGLQALLPYLIRWVGEGVVGILKEGGQGEGDGETLQVLLEVISAILDNTALFAEPYLHQLLPPLLSILLHSTLPPSHSHHLRTTASQTLSHLLTQHSTTYPSLSPRIMKTLLVALVSPNKSLSTREGAIRGLVGVGKEAIRKGLVEGGGARVVGTECLESSTTSTLGSSQANRVIQSVMDAFTALCPPSDMPENLNPSVDEDMKVIIQLKETLGDYFASRLMGDAAWARGVISGKVDV